MYCMLDPIPSKLLKEVLPEVTDPLLAIINSSLSLGYVPKNFKLAVIKPLIKKTQLDPKDLVNYRPISNLPFLSKILEKVVSSQLYSFLEKNDICDHFQSGFRPYHSTKTAPGDRLNGFKNGQTQLFNSRGVGKWAYFQKKVECSFKKQSWKFFFNLFIYFFFYLLLYFGRCIMRFKCQNFFFFALFIIKVNLKLLSQFTKIKLGFKTAFSTQQD